MALQANVKMEIVFIVIMYLAIQALISKGWQSKKEKIWWNATDKINKIQKRKSWLQKARFNT